MTADARTPDTAAGRAPERAGLVLAALILVAGVANLNLSGAPLVFFAFPGREQEQQLLAEYEAEDADAPEDRPSPGPDGAAGAEPAPPPEPEPERPAYAPPRG